MWLTILKYAARVAVATGLADKAKGWIKSKISGACDKAEDAANKYVEKVEVKVDDIMNELDTK